MEVAVPWLRSGACGEVLWSRHLVRPIALLLDLRVVHTTPAAKALPMTPREIWGWDASIPPVFCFVSGGGQLGRMQSERILAGGAVKGREVPPAVRVRGGKMKMKTRDAGRVARRRGPARVPLWYQRQSRMVVKLKTRWQSRDWGRRGSGGHLGLQSGHLRLGQKFRGWSTDARAGGSDAVGGSRRCIVFAPKSILSIHPSFVLSFEGHKVNRGAGEMMQMHGQV